MFFVYIIFSASSNIYYKGFCVNIEKRLRQHNENESRYTAQKGPWVLVFARKFDTKKKALKYEKMLKRQNRSYILWLLEQDYNILKK